LIRAKIGSFLYILISSGDINARAPGKEEIERGTEWLEEIRKQGIKFQSYWTLGRYDAVAIMKRQLRRTL
jgi:uncharacterized protein with GYD domain